jgi:DinB superfamily
MKETIEQYKARIQSYASGKEPLKVQSSTGAKLEKLIKRVPKAKLRKRPAPDKWSIAEILAHLEDAEIVIGYRMRTILGAPGTPIQAFDQDKWAEAENYAKRDPHDALAVFQKLRATNVRLLKSLKPEQWKHFGMHSERGEESIERIAMMTAGHDINHLKQIEEILAKPGKG